MGLRGGYGPARTELRPVAPEHEACARAGSTAPARAQTSSAAGHYSSSLPGKMRPAGGFEGPLAGSKTAPAVNRGHYPQVLFCLSTPVGATTGADLIIPLGPLCRLAFRRPDGAGALAGRLCDHQPLFEA
jgi:hypothetical protein